MAASRGYLTCRAVSDDSDYSWRSPVNTRPGFGVDRHEYSGAVFLNSPGWTEAAAHLLYDTTFADADGKYPFPRDRAAMVAAIRAAVTDYAAIAGYAVAIGE